MAKKHLLAALEFGPMKLWRVEKSKLVEVTEDFGLEKSHGFWQTVYPMIDKNGNLNAFVAGNLGTNTFFKTSEEKPLCIYSNDFDENGEHDAILCAYFGEKSYPLVSRDRLLHQMTTLRKKYLRYNHFANQTIEDIFPSDKVKNAKQFPIYVQETSIFELKAGKFVRSALPVESQLSQVRGIEGYTDAKGLFHIITVGNFWETDFDYGKYDASVGAIHTYMNGKWKTLKHTGLAADGNIRRVAHIISQGKTAFVVAGNNEAPFIYTVK